MGKAQTRRTLSTQRGNKAQFYGLFSFVASPALRQARSAAHTCHGRRCRGVLCTSLAPPVICLANRAGVCLESVPVKNARAENIYTFKRYSVLWFILITVALSFNSYLFPHSFSLISLSTGFPVYLSSCPLPSPSCAHGANGGLSTSARVRLETEMLSSAWG